MKRHSLLHLCFVLNLSLLAADEPARLDLAPVVERELAAGKTVIEASLAAMDEFLAFMAAHPGAPIVLDSSVPSTPDGSSPAWNAIRSVRRFVDGSNVCWKTVSDRRRYLYWTPDQDKEDKAAPCAAYPDGRLALKNKAGEHWWAKRVREKTSEVNALRGKTVDVVFVGDSITHFLEGRWGQHDVPWPSVTAFTNGLATLNLGIGGDRTEHALWRTKYGLLDGYRAKCVSILIGTNNDSKRDSATDIVRAISDLVKIVREKQPEATVVLTALLPREYAPDDPKEIKNRAVNAELRKLVDGKRVLWLDFGDKLRGPDGKLRKEFCCDGVHPNDAGYKIWLEAFKDLKCL